MSDETMQAAHEFLNRWGYGDQDRLETEYKEALKRIEELKVEARVLREILYSMLKERF